MSSGWVIPAPCLCLAPFLLPSLAHRLFTLLLYTHRPFDCLHLSPPLHFFLLKTLPPRPRWSFRPARSLVSSTYLLRGSPTGHSGLSETLPASTLLSPTFLHFPLAPLVPSYSVGHSGHLGRGSLLFLLQVSHQSFRLVRYCGSTFLLGLLSFHHLSAPYITYQKSPSLSHRHPLHLLLTFPSLPHRLVPSWSFRPARYVFLHSFLPHTHTTPYGIPLVIPAHQIPLTLQPFIVFSYFTALVFSLPISITPRFPFLPPLRPFSCSTSNWEYKAYPVGHSGPLDTSLPYIGHLPCSLYPVSHSGSPDTSYKSLLCPCTPLQAPVSRWSFRPTSYRSWGCCLLL